MKQPADASNHVFVLHELAPISLLNTPPHPYDEAGVIFEHPRNRVFHQLLGVLAIGGGHLLKPRFDVGREMHFHALQGTPEPAVTQHSGVL